MHRIQFDFLKLPDATSGCGYLLVVIDSFTKYAWARPLKNRKAEGVAKFLVNEIFLKFGVPKEILSDNAKEFTQSLIPQIAERLEISQHTTSGYAPQTNGLTEKLNQTLIKMLAMLSDEQKTDWPKYLPAVLFAYNTSVHSATKQIPFFLMHGFVARTPFDMQLESPTDTFRQPAEYVKTLVYSCQIARALAAENLESAIENYKKVHDQKIKPFELKCGDMVYMVQPRRDKKLGGKCAVNYVGPYRLVGLNRGTAKILASDDPSDPPIMVNYNKLVKCPPSFKAPTEPDLDLPPRENQYFEDSNQPMGPTQENPSTTFSGFNTVSEGQIIHLTPSEKLIAYEQIKAERIAKFEEAQAEGKSIEL